MTSLEKKELLRQPDAVLMKSGREIEDFVKYYTVPLFFFDGPVEKGRLKAQGSGVLVRVCGRFFVFTAGHCVKDGEGLTAAMGVQARQHRFEIQWVEARCIHEKGSGGRDIGYFEIPQMKARDIESSEKVFMSLNRLWVVETDDVMAADDWMIICGYPSSIAVELPEKLGRGVRLLNYTSTLAGSGEAPDSPLLAAAPSIRSIDVWMPKVGNVESKSGEAQDVSVPALQGASGGGCWKSNVRPNPSDWKPDKLKLTAIHIGSSAQEHEINGESHVFSREVLVGHHLRMIAEDFDDLRDKIYSEWPFLSGWPAD